MNSAAQATMPRLYRQGRNSYALLWLLVFFLYLPTMHAGFVSDTTGWIKNLHTLSFSNYVNDSMSATKSMYQLTQLVTWFFYRLFGTNIILWRLLFISLQALNAWLACLLVRSLLADSGMAQLPAARYALAGSILFCLSPHINEVMVWNAAYHYLQGIALMLGTLVASVRYLHTLRLRYALTACALFLLGNFAIELFYLTPFMLGAMLLYYRMATGVDKQKVTAALRYCLLPILLLFVLRLLLYAGFYHKWTPHVTQAHWEAGQAAAYWAKPLKYLFHLLFMGRFFSHDVRIAVYTFCERVPVIIAFYSLLLATIGFLLLRIRHCSPAVKVASLCYVWCCMGLAVVLPLWFYDLFLVTFDRYLYHICAFFYFIPVLLISCIRYRWLRGGLMGLLALTQLYFAMVLVRLWHQSERAVSSLQQNFPNPKGRTLLLLDLPHDLCGIPMMSSNDSSEFLLMHNELFPPPLQVKTYDVLSFNMVSRNDGAHVQVKNDSTVSVILNQWGTWWWHNDLGANNYETVDYRIKIDGGGLYYDLTLKRPYQGYLLLYQTAGHWKEVDWTRKGVDQY